MHRDHKLALLAVALCLLGGPIAHANMLAGVLMIGAGIGLAAPMMLHDLSLSRPPKQEAYTPEPWPRTYFDAEYAYEANYQLECGLLRATLAVIYADDGEYLLKHGLEKAAADASEEAPGMSALLSKMKDRSISLGDAMMEALALTRVKKTRAPAPEGQSNAYG